MGGAATDFGSGVANVVSSAECTTTSLLAGEVATAGFTGLVSATANGIVNDDLSFRSLVTGALGGIVTSLAGNVTSINTMGLNAAGEIVNFGERLMGITGQATLKGALAELAGGNFSDGLREGFIDGLAHDITQKMASMINAKETSGALGTQQASALRILTRATGSAIRALGNPNDRNFVAASGFIKEWIANPPQGLENQGPETAQPPQTPPATVIIDEEGHLAPGVIDTTLPESEQAAQLQKLLIKQGMNPEEAESLAASTIARNTTGPGTAKPGTKKPVATEPGDLPVEVLPEIVVRAKREPATQLTDDAGNTILAQGEAASVSNASGIGLLLTAAGRSLSAAELMAGITELVAGASEVIGAGATELALGMARLLSLPAATLTLLFTPGNRTEQVTDLGNGTRFLTSPGDLYGQFQKLGPDGNWVTLQGRVQLEQVNGRAVLTEEERRELGAPEIINVPPNEPPAGPLVTPVPGERAPVLPGFPAVEPGGPQVLVNPVEVQLTVDDLIIESRGFGEPGSESHKAATWEYYQSRGGELDYEQWSSAYEVNQTRATGANTARSPVDIAHAIGADYTKAGKPTGGHSLLNGDVRIVPGTESVPDAFGVYEASIQVPAPQNPGQWITKTSNNSTNSMFPKNWDAARIQSEVDAAWNSPSKVVNGDGWTSFTPSGVKVGGFISPRTTVYPIYQP